MKKLSTFTIILLLVTTCFAQKKYYRTSGEYIFSFSNVSKNNVTIDSKMRFSFFFHLGEYFNYDFNNKIGLYSGLGIRNIGIITNEEDILIKRRSYSAGIPIAFKFGTFNKNSFIYAGSEYEYLFHYKEKSYTDEGKITHKKWGSNITNTFLPSVFAGIQFKRGINFKFKYYLDNFLNSQYTEKENNIVIKPFKNLKTQIFYISITFNLNKYKFDNLKKLPLLKKESKIIEV